MDLYLYGLVLTLLKTRNPEDFGKGLPMDIKPSTSLNSSKVSPPSEPREFFNAKTVEGKKKKKKPKFR